MSSKHFTGPGPVIYTMAMGVAMRRPAQAQEKREQEWSGPFGLPLNVSLLGLMLGEAVYFGIRGRCASRAS